MTTMTPDTEVQRRFRFFQDEALKGPVLISENGRPRTVLLSYDEFKRLKRSDRRAYDVADLPPHLSAAILETTVPDDVEGA